MRHSPGPRATDPGIPPAARDRAGRRAGGRAAALRGRARRRRRRRGARLLCCAGRGAACGARAGAARAGGGRARARAAGRARVPAGLCRLAGLRARRGCIRALQARPAAKRWSGLRSGGVLCGGGRRHARQARAPQNSLCRNVRCAWCSVQVCLSRQTELQGDIGQKGTAWNALGSGRSCRRQNTETLESMQGAEQCKQPHGAAPSAMTCGTGSTAPPPSGYRTYTWINVGQCQHC